MKSKFYGDLLVSELTGKLQKQAPIFTASTTMPTKTHAPNKRAVWYVHTNK